MTTEDAAAELTVTKKADKTTEVKSGDEITYTVVVTNTGNVSVKDIALSDSLVTLSEAAFELAPSESKTVTYKYTVTDADITAGKIENTATASGDAVRGDDPEDATASVTVTTVILITAENGGGVYNATPYGLTNVTKTLETAELQYSIDNGATWSTNVPTVVDVLNSLEKTVSVRAVLEGYVSPQIDGLSIIVTPREVTLTSESGDKPYDGTPLTKPTVTGWEQSGDTGFVTGEVSDVKATGSVTTVAEGEVTNTIVFTEGANFKVDNYTITKNEGTLTITPKSIEDPDDPGNVDLDNFTVSGPENTKYNGTEQKQPVTVTDKVTGKEITATITYERVGEGDKDDITNAGTIKVTITGTGNYKGTVTKEYEITPRDVTLTSADDEKVYDGKALTNHNVSVSGDGFVKEEGATFDVTGSQTLVGSSNNTFTYALNSSTLAMNYIITMAEGILRVTDGTGPDEPPVNPDDVGTKTHQDREYKLGETVTWTITATNIYAEAKTITLVEKDGFTLAQSTFADVAPGETISTTATHVVTEADIAAGEINNSVQVQFKGGTSVVIPDPIPVKPEDPNSSLSIAKTADAPAYNVGDTITYTIAVTNTGNQTLTNIALTDTMRGIAGVQPVLPSATIDSLAPGISRTVQVTYRVIAQDAGNSVQNTATATTTDPNDPTRTITSTVTTPGEPITPVPAPTPAPVTPTTPIAFVPATPAAAVPATPAAPAVTPVADNPTPQAESINDDGNALGEGEGTWSLFDLIATVVATILAAIMLILAFGRNRKEGDDEETAAAKTANGEEVESDEVYKRKRLGRVLSVIPAAASIVLFILTQDMTQPMAIFDQWSIVFGIIGIINIVLAIVTRKKTEDGDDEQQQQTPQSGFVPAGPASL